MRKLSTQKSARQVAPKPQRPSLLPPPRGFEYEAFGFLEGELVADDDNYYLIADGERHTIKGFSDRLLRTLSGQQTPITGFLVCIPSPRVVAPSFGLSAMKHPPLRLNQIYSEFMANCIRQREMSSLSGFIATSPTVQKVLFW